jgi:hypothetical protein
MAIAFNLFFGNALMGIEYLKRPHYSPYVRGRTLGGNVNLFLQLKASDENNSRTSSL